MAVAAERLQEMAGLSHGEALQKPYVNLDAIYVFVHERNHARAEAESILAANHRELIDGHFDSVLPPVDALGSGRRVVAAENQFGHESSVSKELFEGLVLDCQRLYAEAYRKNTWEYFPEVRQEFDLQTGDYYSHGYALSEVVKGGLSPVAETEEQERRKNEYVEERTYRFIGRSIAAQALSIESVAVRTISECADWAIEAWQDDVRHGRPARGYGGYVPEINKFMIRNVRFEQDCRYEEQVGLCGTYITRDIIIDALQRTGAIEQGVEPDKTTLHSMQLSASDDLLDFVKLLDSLATEKHGVTIFMGELAGDQPGEYTQVKREAKMRQFALQLQSRELADFIVGHARMGTDPYIAEKIIEERVKQEMFRVARSDPKAAAVMFDERTASGYEEVARLRADGKHDEAMQLMRAVEQQAPAPGYCGADSCGIRSVDVNSEEAESVKELLKAETGDNIAHDEERACKNCGKKTVFYAYTLTKVNKACTSCKSFESRKTSAKQSDEYRRRSVSATRERAVA